MDWSAAFGFWSLSLLMAMTPGVDWAFAISAGLSPGGTLPAVGGMLSGHLVAVLVVAAGVAGVVSSSQTAMIALTIAGAGYLIWLGVSALRHPAVPELSGADAAPLSPVRLAVKGLGVSLLNPKVFLLFLAMLPQFVRPEAGLPTGAQMIVLGLLHIANCAAVYLAVGYGAGIVLSQRPAIAKVVGRLSGIVMILLGSGLIVEQVAG